MGMEGEFALIRNQRQRETNQNLGGTNLKILQVHHPYIQFQPVPSCPACQGGVVAWFPEPGWWTDSLSFILWRPSLWGLGGIDNEVQPGAESRPTKGWERRIYELVSIR